MQLTHPFCWCSKLGALIIFILFLGPQIWCIATQTEKWPFTCAPMFAHPVGPDVEKSEIEFEGIKKNGTTVKILISDINLSTLRTMRHFLTDVYGVSGTKSPFAKFASDTPQALQTRLGTYFEAFGKRLHRYGSPDFQDLEAIRIRIVPLRDGATPTIIGKYDFARRAFYMQDRI